MFTHNKLNFFQSGNKKHFEWLSEKPYRTYVRDVCVTGKSQLELVYPY